MNRQRNSDNGSNCVKENYNSININNYSNNINGVKRKDGLQWTNERHSKFLNSMEASFVQNMLGKSSNATISKQSKLDRFVPDISESTLDLRTSAHLSNGVIRTCNKQIKTPKARPCKIVHDQVVPQLEEKAGGRIEIDLNN